MDAGAPAASPALDASAAPSIVACSPHRAPRSAAFDEIFAFDPCDPGDPICNNVHPRRTRVRLAPFAGADQIADPAELQRAIARYIATVHVHLDSAPTTITGKLVVTLAPGEQPIVRPGGGFAAGVGRAFDGVVGSAPIALCGAPDAGAVTITIDITSKRLGWGVGDN